jgi:TPP-dependent pyruvate/acetoin dehydrogenase alpha subunit
MIRSKFDPPEYRDWKPDADVVRAFAKTAAGQKRRRSIIDGLSRSEHEDLYRGLVRFRLFDTSLKRWVQQGVISKAWLGTGEEAVSIGCVRALRRSDVIGPMIRNAGACFEVGMAMSDHFAGYLGTTESATRGRDIHVGDLEHGVIAPISHVGSLVPVMAGLALSFKMKRDKRVAMTWVGDGATRTGEVHESINFAAVQKLPIVIIVQNNQVALGSRNAVESVASLDVWVRGYGITPLRVDGNNILDVHAAAVLAVERCRRGKGPAVLVAETFRMGGHATHDEQQARSLFSPEEFSAWGKRDPIGNYEEWLLNTAGFDRASLDALEKAVAEAVESSAEASLKGRETHQPDPSTVAEGVYAD